MKKRILAFLAGMITTAIIGGLSMTALASESQVISFSDVSENAWYYAAVTELAEKGVISGVGNGRFEPLRAITCAEFVTIVTRQFYEIRSTGAGAAWYSVYIDTAEVAGVLTGVESEPEELLTRFDMAQLIYNVVQDKAFPVVSADPSAIGDWVSVPENYRDAILACYGTSLISGKDSDGTFNGTSTLTRAEAAAIMSRLLSKLNPIHDAETEPASTYDTANACELGKQYTTDSGYGVTVNSAETHKVKGVNTFSFKYTLKNMTSDKYLYEDTFTIIFTDGTSSNQGGIYLDGMYPGDTLTKTFNLILEDKQVAYLLFNDGSSFFFSSPEIADMNTHLVWVIK